MLRLKAWRRCFDGNNCS